MQDSLFDDMLPVDIFCMDASAFIGLWKDYPVSTYPHLWRMLAEKRMQIIIPKPVYDEIRDKPLQKWFKENKFDKMAYKLSEEAEEQSIHLEIKYDADSSIKKGAGKNDIQLIAYAKVERCCVVTLEKDQKPPPNEMRNWKIPAVCREEDVMCINFKQMLKELGIPLPVTEQE